MSKIIKADLDEIVEAVKKHKQIITDLSDESVMCLTGNDLRTALERFVVEDGWISVEDRLPYEGVIVIGYFPNRNESGEEVSTAFYDGNNVRSDFPNSTSYAFVATHWMPLPPAPTPKKGGEDEGN